MQRGRQAAVIVRMTGANPATGSRIIVAASLRERTPSLVYADDRWLFTVLSARNSFAAISALVKPMTSMLRTCFSRIDRLSLSRRARIGRGTQITPDRTA